MVQELIQEEDEVQIEATYIEKSGVYRKFLETCWEPLKIIKGAEDLISLLTEEYNSFARTLKYDQIFRPIKTSSEEVSLSQNQEQGRKERDLSREKEKKLI